MPKLHEILAVEGPLRAQAEKTRGELATTFEKKRHLFSEKVVTFIPLEENAAPVQEEQSTLSTTVLSELSWISGIWSKAIDAAFRIDEANTVARADVILDNGITLLKDVPVTALLQLEKRTEEVRELISGIPTLDPAKGFTPDTNRGKHIYQAREDRKIRTKKTQQALVLYEATKEHPAQVKEISVDVPTGTIQTQEWSGLITPAEKAEMLERAEALKRAVKQARSRANGVDVKMDSAVAEKMLTFVFGVTPATSTGPSLVPAKK